MNTTLVISMMTAKALELLSMPEDEFNRLNEMEMAAEIERQADPRDKLALAQHATLLEAMAEIERLRARVAELEAIVTVGHGTMGTLQPGTGPSGDEPATITHGHAPSAPPHDER